MGRGRIPAQPAASAANDDKFERRHVSARATMVLSAAGAIGRPRNKAERAAVQKKGSMYGFVSLKPGRPTKNAPSLAILQCND